MAGMGHLDSMGAQGWVLNPAGAGPNTAVRRGLPVGLASVIFCGA